jgi:hypothetical protein
MMRLWLYRVKEIDDDGDPLDHGVVKATTVKLAQKLVTKRLQEVLGDGSYPVRLYMLRDQLHAGVLGDGGMTDFIANTEKPPDGGPCCERDTNADGNCDQHPDEARG